MSLNFLTINIVDEKFISLVFEDNEGYISQLTFRKKDVGLIKEVLDKFMMECD